MTLENLIVRYVYNWPSLYYKDTWEKSRKAVLRQLFTVIGNGIDLRDGEIKCKYKLPFKRQKEIKERLKRAEPIIVLDEVDLKKSVEHDKFITPYFSSAHKPIIFFKDDPKLKDLILVEDYSKYKDYGGRNVFIADEYPKISEDFEPYPFSFYHLPFVIINPHYKKYNYSSIDNMTVEELAESKNLIPADYSPSIVEIYQDCLSFFSSDKFYKSRYYNVKPHSDSLKTVNQRLKNDLEQLCEDFGLPLKKYVDAEEFYDTLSKKRAQERVNQCEKIIAAFS